MDDLLKHIMTYVAIPGIVGGATYFMKSLFERINTLEKEIPKKVEEVEVRQLLDDKIEPIREDIQELKITMGKIYDLLMRK